MRCEQVRPLLPEYVMGWLEDQVRREVDAHLAGCPACTAEFQAYMDATASLALTLPQVRPRAQVKARLMARVEPARKPWWARLPRWAVAAPQRTVVALAVLVVFLLVSNLTLWVRVRRLAQVQQQMPFRMVVLRGTERVPEAQGVLLFEPQHQYAVLVVKGLPPTEPGRAYQLWLIRPDGHRVSGAVFSMAPSSQWKTVVVESPEPLERFPAFGITIEPAGGSPQPTGPKVMGGSAEF